MNRRKFLKIACYGGAAALFASYPVFIERNLVQINNYRIPVPSLPKAFSGFRVVHLTDLHFGFLVSESFIEGVIKKANSLKPSRGTSLNNKITRQKYLKSGGQGLDGAD